MSGHLQHFCTSLAPLPRLAHPFPQLRLRMTHVTHSHCRFFYTCVHGMGGPKPGLTITLSALDAALTLPSAPTRTPPSTAAGRAGPGMTAGLAPSAAQGKHTGMFNQSNTKRVRDGRRWTSQSNENGPWARNKQSHHTHNKQVDRFGRHKSMHTLKPQT